jgi:filamentous hemagglutinin
MTNNAGVLVSGSGSLVDLASLTNKSGGRMVVLDNLGVLSAPVLDSITANTLQAYGGGTLDLRSATSYDGGVQGNSVLASGAGSRVDLSSTVMFAGSTGASCGNCTPYETTVSAENGGVTDLSAVTTMTNNTGVLVSGSGSRVDLASLTSKGVGRMVVLDNLGVLSAPVLATVTANTLQAFGGGVLDLSSVTSYSGGVRTNSVQASGSGSRVDLSSATTFSGSTGASCGICSPFQTFIQGQAGGLVELGVVILSQNLLIDAETGAVGGGAMTISAGTNLLAAGTILGDVVNQGSLRLLNAPGGLTITGNYGQAATAGLFLTLSGLTPASQHDQIQVMGHATLGGALGISLAAFIRVAHLRL